MINATIDAIKSPRYLKAAGKMVTMRGRDFSPIGTMTALPDHDPKPSIFDDPDALSSLMDRSFAEAKQEAIGDNDRRGVPSYGTRDGKRDVRQTPPAAAPGVT